MDEQWPTYLKAPMATQAQHNFLAGLLKKVGSTKSPIEYLKAIGQTPPHIGSWAGVSVNEASRGIDTIKKSLFLPTTRGRKGSFEEDENDPDLVEAQAIVAKPTRYSQPKPEPHTAPEHTIASLIDTAMIARAAEAIIKPKLDAALSDFSKMKSNLEAEMAIGLPSRIDSALSPLRADLLNLVHTETRAVSQRVWEEFQPTVRVPLEQTNDGVEPTFDQDHAASLIPQPDPNFHFDPDATRAVRTALKLRSNLYIEGPTGCGKTELVTQVCAKTSRPLLRVNMHGDVTKETFIGGWTVEEGATKFHYGALPTAMKLGAVLLVDEIDYTPPHIAAVLNPVLERSGHLFITETGEKIKPVQGFVILATANSGGKGDNTGVYTGTEVLNSAFLNRFNKITMSYIPADHELSMLQNRFPSTQAPLDSLVKIATEVRAAFTQQQIAVTLSTRGLIEAVRWFDEGYKLDEALGVVLTNWLDADDINLVQTIIDRVDVNTSQGQGPNNDYYSSSAQFNAYIENRSRIDAIKELHQHHLYSLGEAKRAVEAILDDGSITPRQAWDEGRTAA